MKLMKPRVSGVALVVAAVVASERAHAEFPSLKDAIERARTKGPAALVAAADVRVAGATRYGAGLPPLTNPYLEIFIDRTKETRGLAAAQANLWLPIELSGQRGKRIAEVDAMVAWKQTAKLAAQSNAVGEAVAAYGEVLVAAARRQHTGNLRSYHRHHRSGVRWGSREALAHACLPSLWSRSHLLRWQVSAAVPPRRRLSVRTRSFLQQQPR